MSSSLHNETLQTNSFDETGGCIYSMTSCSKIVSEYDQEIPQSQTADNPMAPKEEPLNHRETPGRHIKQSNQLSLFPIKMIAILVWI